MSAVSRGSPECQQRPSSKVIDHIWAALDLEGGHAWLHPKRDAMLDIVFPSCSPILHPHPTLNPPFIVSGLGKSNSFFPRKILREGNVCRGIRVGQGPSHHSWLFLETLGFLQEHARCLSLPSPTHCLPPTLVHPGMGNPRW